MFHEGELFFLTFMPSETWNSPKKNCISRCKSLESFLPFVVRKLPSAFVFVICSDNTAASRVASAAGRAAVPCMLPAPAPSDLISCRVIFTSLTLLTTLPFFCTGKTEYEGDLTLGSSVCNFWIWLYLCRIQKFWFPPWFESDLIVTCWAWQPATLQKLFAKSWFDKLGL